VSTPAQAELLEGAVALFDEVIAGIRPGTSFEALWRRGQE
jgi:hypothetical protein